MASLNITIKAKLSGHLRALRGHDPRYGPTQARASPSEGHNTGLYRGCPSGQLIIILAVDASGGHFWPSGQQQQDGEPSIGEEGDQTGPQVTSFCSLSSEQEIFDERLSAVCGERLYYDDLTSRGQRATRDTLPNFSQHATYVH